MGIKWVLSLISFQKNENKQKTDSFAEYLQLKPVYMWLNMAVYTFPIISIFVVLFDFRYL